MASFKKRGASWTAEIRRAGHPPQAKSFPTKALAVQWAREIEQLMDAAKYRSPRMLADIKLTQLIDQYTTEFAGKKGFGKNKTAVLKNLKLVFVEVKVNELTAARLKSYVQGRIAGGAGGVTIGIDLTYLAGVLQVAKLKWGMPVDTTVVAEARNHIKYAGLSTKSSRRTRRPSDDEVQRLKAHYISKKRTPRCPMEDIIEFAIETAMRLSEITRITWADLNEPDRTVIIRDRKDPKEKKGNDQEVPLLGTAFDVIMRQPREDERIFPYNASTISTVFPRAVQTLGIQDLHFHDFRHEGCSRLFEQGYTIEQVALVSGHKDWNMLARYTQLKAKSLHRTSASPA